MASVIERYQQQQQPNGQMLAANARGHQEAPTIGPDATHLADELNDYAVKRDDANQKLWLISRQATDELQAQQMLDEAQRTAPAGGSISQTLTDNWTKYKSSQSDTIDNPSLQQRYSEQLTSIGSMLSAKGLQFDNDEQDRFMGQSFTDGYNNKAKLYSTIKDPMELQAKLKDDVGQMSTTLDETPMAPAKRAKLKEDMVKNLSDAANTQWISTDPEGYKSAHALGLPDAVREGDPSLPRGVRNNNPGNIEKGKDAWQGAAGDDGRYVKFSTPEAGLRAMAVNLKNQQKLHGINTVEDLITKYAPPSENNTASYISTVSTALGVGPQDKIDLSNPDTLKTVMTAMIQHENSAQPYSPKSIAWATTSALDPAKAGEAPATVATATDGDGNPVRGHVQTGSSAWNLGTYEQQKNWIELADRQAKAKRGEQEKADAVVHARTGSDMQIAAERGGLTYAQVEEAYKNKTITPETRTSLTKQLDEQNHMDAKSRMAMQRVNQAVGGVAVLDPKNTDDKDAVDVHFKASMADITASSPPEDVQPKALALVKQYGMVPKSLQGQVRAQLRSGNTDDMASAADTLAKLRAINPQLLNDFAEEDIKAGNHIDSLVQAGFTPQQAVARASNDLKMSPDIKEARSADFKEKMKASPASDYIKSSLNSYWRSDPSDIPPEMQSQFSQLAEAEYIRTGNFSAAQKTAGDFISRTWGQTGIGIGIDDSTGNRWMKNAPEMYYGAPVAGVNNSRWMKEQLVHDVTEMDKLRPQGAFKPDSLMLTTSPVKAPDGRPTYYVFYKDENGVLNQFGGDAGPVVWHPEWEKSAQRDRMLRAARDKQKAKETGDIGGSIALDVQRGI